MVFSNLFFLYFFLPLNLICYFLAKSIHVRNGILIVFSLFFYAWGEPRYVPLLVGMVLINWIFGLMIEKYRGQKLAKAGLIGACICSLTLLGIFKYLTLILGTTHDLFGLPSVVPQILLPIGISFYTFQLLSYVVDVYRGEVEAQTHFFRLLLYTSLFHQCIAGPIVRYKDISEEILYRQINRGEVARGINRFAAGLAKKAVLANTCGLLADQFILTDAAVADVSQFTQNAAALSAKPAVILWMGVLFFMLQIYLDFSAYSDMAIGLGKIFGFHFLENFDYPYISKSVTEFWRRWHISLSTWFRDYIYIPLGGSYCSKKRQAFNMFVVWACTGMWHGAAWNFVVWGMWFYILLVGEKYLWGKGLGKMPAVFQHIYALLAAVISWVFFRAPDLPYAFDYLKAMFSFGGTLTDSQAVYYLLQYAPELILCVIASIPVKKYAENALRRRAGLDCGPDSAAGGEERLGRNAAAFLLTWGPKILALCLLMLSYTELVTGSFNPFIYFRF